MSVAVSAVIVVLIVTGVGSRVPAVIVVQVMTGVIGP
jgi:hypothetical protein